MIFLLVLPRRGEPSKLYSAVTKKDDIPYFFMSYFTVLKLDVSLIHTGFGFINTPDLFTFSIS